MGVSPAAQNPTAAAPDRPKAAPWQHPLAPAAVFILLTGMLVAAESVAALAVVVMEGGLALLVLACAAAAGVWLVHALGLGREPPAARWVAGAGLGIGGLSLGTLVLGWLGLLTRPMVGVWLAAVALAGAGRLAMDLSPAPGGAATPRPMPASGWLWLAAVPFAAVTLLAGAMPPGVLWAEEGGGYDVLEYHLAVPGAFFEQGRIGFLPHNVYSNFPLNSEMLSLLMMTLRGGRIEAALMATLVNAWLAVLLAAAAWQAGRRLSPENGLPAGLLAAGTPWVAYLAGIAYVEVGMLATGMCALAAAIEAARGGPRGWRWALVAGLLAGLACGFKYTAVVLVTLPLGAALACWLPENARRIRFLGLFAAGAALTFSPWLIRNTVNTGNPVFPLAYAWLGARTGTWDAELQERWARAHEPPALRQGFGPAVSTALRHSVGDPRLGPAVLVLAAAGAIRRRDRWTGGLLVMLAIQAAAWGLATHLFARFAVVLLMPLLLLAGRAVEGLRRPFPVRLTYGALLAGLGLNLVHLAGLYYHHTRLGPEAVRLDAFDRCDLFVDGRWPGMEYLQVVNALGASARLMLVGEARTFYVRVPCVYATVFNHHPLGDIAARVNDAAGVLAELRRDGITHLLVHWGEMARLRNSYGFDPRVNEDLIGRLEAAGLRRSGEFRTAEDRPVYATLYEVGGHE